MLTVVIGGAGSGKSAFAETLTARYEVPRFYVAAMKPYGAESVARIERHRKQRARLGFETIERYTDIGGLILPSRGAALLECLCNLTANEMFDENGSGDKTVSVIVRGVQVLEAQCLSLVVVTNEVGNDGIDYDEGTMRYIKMLGAINIRLAKAADCVVEIVCGVPSWLKGSMV